MTVTARPASHRLEGPAVLFRRARIMPRIAAVAAGVIVASGLAVGSSTSAEASTVWDRVAQCESGGNWKINTGNGHYGGLQFTASTWRAFGGTTYAPRAHQATKAQQITIAKKVLKTQGPGAWPTCSRKAGLTRANGAAVNVSASSSSAKTTAPKAASGKLAVDGRFGPASTRAMEKWLGTSVNGSMSSADIRALQRKVGARADGRMGPETTRKVQQYLGVRTNGARDFRHDRTTVLAFQRHLNKHV
ncbi:MAG: transglycosylase family protein [Micrococcus sp.]|nr:transglycosylase family protein [Micrococcus sp.]